jgi:hypothetical protein
MNSDLMSSDTCKFFRLMVDPEAHLIPCLTVIFTAKAGYNFENKK